MKEIKDCDEYYFCKKCNKEFTIDECSQGGAPISGTYFESPCCKRDVHWEDDIEERERNVKITKWYSEQEIKDAIDKTNKESKDAFQSMIPYNLKKELGIE